MKMERVMPIEEKLSDSIRFSNRIPPNWISITVLEYPI